MTATGKKLSISQICILVGLSIPLLKNPNLDYFVYLGDLKIKKKIEINSVKFQKEFHKIFWEIRKFYKKVDISSGHVSPTSRQHAISCLFICQLARRDFIDESSDESKTVSK